MLDNSDEQTIPTSWPRNLNPPPSFYFHQKTLADAATLRAQGLKRYRKDPAAWIARVREWQGKHPDYVAAYQAWWWRENRSEDRLAKIREYSHTYRLRKKFNGALSQIDTQQCLDHNRAQ